MLPSLGFFGTGNLLSHQQTWQEGATRPWQLQVTVTKITEGIFLAICSVVDGPWGLLLPSTDAEGRWLARRPALVLQLGYCLALLCSAMLRQCRGCAGVMGAVLFVIQSQSQHQSKPRHCFAYLSGTSFP